jgi:hypothetical protein
MSDAPTLATTPTPSAAPAAGPPAAPETNSIPGFEKMSFEQRREAQDRNAARRNSR